MSFPSKPSFMWWEFFFDICCKKKEKKNSTQKKKIFFRSKIAKIFFSSFISRKFQHLISIRWPTEVLILTSATSLGGGRSCISVFLEAHHPQMFRKWYFWFWFHITEKVFSWKSNLRLSCRLPLLRGWGRLLVRLKFLFWFDVWLPSGVWKTKFLLWKHFLWAWGLFSSCNLNSEWLQFVRKLC